jgi:hypothetical protein
MATRETGELNPPIKRLTLLPPAAVARADLRYRPGRLCRGSRPEHTRRSTDLRHERNAELERSPLGPAGTRLLWRASVLGVGAGRGRRGAAPAFFRVGAERRLQSRSRAALTRKSSVEVGAVAAASRCTLHRTAPTKRAHGPGGSQAGAGGTAIRPGTGERTLPFPNPWPHSQWSASGPHSPPSRR